MLKMFKFMKKYWQLAVAIVALLVVQAMADLKLPEYTSNIVNVGIQQGGVESIVPEAVREKQMGLLLLWLEADEQETVLEAYERVDAKELGEAERDALKEKYPVSAYEVIYVLEEERSEEELAALADILLFPEVALQMMQSIPGGEKDGLFGQLEVMGPGALVPMRPQLESQLAGSGEMVQEQMALEFVKAEYEALGIDLYDLQMTYLLATGAKMLGMALLIMIDMILVGFLSARVSAGVGRDLRSAVFGKVVSFSNAEMDRFSTASLITRSTNDIQQVQMVIMMLLRVVCYAPIMGLGGFVKVMNTTPSMAWIVGVAVLGIICLVVVLMSVALPRFKKMQLLVDRVNLVAREILTGLPVIRAFSREHHEEDRFAGANGDLMRNGLFTGRVMNVMMPTMTLMMNGVTVLIVWIGAKHIDLGHLQVGDMMAFITYTMQIVMSFLMLTMMSIMLPRAIVAARRVDEILSSRTSILDPEQPKKPEQVRGVVEFDHVHFRYPGAEEDALEDITFTARPGETTAIIGSTGCGKTTLVRLLPRFYDVTAGQIRLDGVDIRDMTQHDLRDCLGYVPQKGVLFSGTIAENLRFGCVDADDEAIAHAARIAQAADFIEAKPEQYESTVAQGGTNVSGGQKQRLSIARAVAKRPKVYIFDDSFSALDYKTDVALRKALKEEVADSTMIIVAQRIGTILHAEQILVLDEGRIVGKGTHEELMATCETYQQIARSQLSSAELNGAPETSEAKKEKAEQTEAGKEARHE